MQDHLGTQSLEALQAWVPLVKEKVSSFFVGKQNR